MSEKRGWTVQSNLSTTARFFSPQGGHCREVQLYTDLSSLVTLLVRVMESSEGHLSVEIEESPFKNEAKVKPFHIYRKSDCFMLVHYQYELPR